jgi:hypothetical protein
MDRPVLGLFIQEMVNAGLANGRLWILEGTPLWVGRGVRQPCVVCGLKISDQQIQYDVHGPRGSLPVHLSCHLVWRAESDRRGRKPKHP